MDECYRPVIHRLSSYETFESVLVTKAKIVAFGQDFHDKCQEIAVDQA